MGLVCRERVLQIGANQNRGPIARNLVSFTSLVFINGVAERHDGSDSIDFPDRNW